MPDTEHAEESKRCTLFDKPKKFCQRCSEFHAADEWMDHCERYMGAAPIRKCKTCGGDHPLDRWPGNCMPERNWNESDLPVCRSFISDTLPDIKNPLTGLPISSKSELRRQYKAAGVEEVGNEGVGTHPSERVCVPETDEKALERQVATSVKQTLETLRSDNVSNEQMANMLRAPAPKNDLGLAIQ